MRVYVLVATPYAAFGDLLRLSLEESGDYETRIVSTGLDALDAALDFPVHLAILDSDLTDWPVRDLARKLLERRPTMRLLVVPPENNPDHPTVQGLRPHAYLNRPFYMPDLSQIISSAMASDQNALVNDPPDPLESAAQILSWLNQPDHGLEQFSAQIRSTAARAALLARCGIPILTCGDVKEPDVQEFAAILGKYREGIGNSGLARYIRPASGSEQVFLYASPVAGDIMLALIFDTSVALSRASHQARQTARAIAEMSAWSEIPPAELEEEPSADISGPIPEEEISPVVIPAVIDPIKVVDPLEERLQAVIQTTEANTVENEAPEKIEQPEISGPEEPVEEGCEPVQIRSAGLCDANEIGDEEEGGEDGEEDFLSHDPFNLAALLASMPSPDPDPGVQEVDWIPEFIDAGGVEQEAVEPAPAEEGNLQPSANLVETAEEVEPPALEVVPPPSEPVATDPIHSRYETDLPETVVLADEEDDTVPEEPVEKTNIEHTPSMAPLTGLEVLMPWEMPESSAVASPQLDETRPLNVNPAGEIKGRGLPLSRSINGDVIYTCVLAPRMSNLYLTGSLADELSRLLPELSGGFGWKLTGVAVRPEYLQWTLEVPPSVSPGNLIRILRQRTSQRIFKLFPQLTPAHPQGDFWAPGYLIVSGAQTPAAGLLRDFIQQNRRRMAV